LGILDDFEIDEKITKNALAASKKTFLLILTWGKFLKTGNIDAVNFVLPWAKIIPNHHLQ
jgi:hypothetical protein